MFIGLKINFKKILAFLQFLVISDNHYGIIMVSKRSNGVTDIKQDASPAMQDEMFEKDDLTYTVEWNEYLLTHEANIYKQKLDNYGRINMNHISYGVGLSKDKAIADAESKIDA